MNVAPTLQTNAATLAAVLACAAVIAFAVAAGVAAQGTLVPLAAL